MLRSNASELAKAGRIMFRPAPRPARARRAGKRLLPATRTRRALPDGQICQTSIFLEALTLPSAPRRLVEPTPLPIGRQAYTMLARHRCVWCRGAAPVRDLAQIT